VKEMWIMRGAPGMALDGVVARVPGHGVDGRCKRIPSTRSELGLQELSSV